ncbi:MAG: hypothetical protein KAH32_01675 [Chlamydiia bacterium]|nr:hypothetical protein [Chlamydiia bacterium]
MISGMKYLLLCCAFCRSIAFCSNAQEFDFGVESKSMLNACRIAQASIVPIEINTREVAGAVAFGISGDSVGFAASLFYHILKDLVISLSMAGGFKKDINEVVIVMNIGFSAGLFDE